jgi:hypothetical protein
MPAATILAAKRNDAQRAGRKLSTEEIAAALRLRPQTIRAGLCNNGHFMGLRPVKLPNGRLLWDAAEVEALTSGEVA